MDLETMMRQAAGTPPTKVPHDAILKRSRRRRTVRRSVQSAGALVAVVAVLTIAGQVPQSVELRPVSPVDQQPTPEPLGPSGWTAVSFHGLEVSVPPTWDLDDTRCGTPRRDTIILANGGGTPTCFHPGRPGLTVARLTPVEGKDARAWAAVATTPSEVSGRTARTGTGTIDPALQRRSVLVVPDVGVVLSVTLGDRDLAEKIIASARVVDTDSNGCDANVGTPEASGVDVPDTGLVRPDPSGGTVCRYVDGWVARSVRLRPTAAVALADALNELEPAGPEPLDDSCRKDDAGRGFVVHFQYPDASDDDVAAFIDECRLRVDNGVRSGRVDFAVTQALTGAAGYDAGLPNWGELSTEDDATDGLSMRMEFDVVPPGEVPRAVIENQGPSHVTTGHPFELQRWTGTLWQVINRRQGFRLPIVSIGPGTSHRFDVQVFFTSPQPVRLEPGRYRVTKTVQHDGRDLRLSADFFVTGD